MSVLVVLLAFWLPGLVVGAAIRLRGWTLAAIAPALTFGGVAMGVTLFGKLGLSWTLFNVSLWFLALAAVGGVAAWLVARRGPETDADDPRFAPRKLSPGGHGVIAVGVLAGLAVGFTVFLRGVKDLGYVQQDWDAGFHGNLVRWIAEHANATPSTVGAIANSADATNYFYPDTYHALLALLLDKAGLDMAHLLNLAALAGVLAWPLGVAALGVAWRMPAVGTAVAAAVSTWFSAFPYDSLWRGPLWPYVAGVALVPAVLAVLRLLFISRGLGGPLALALATAGLVGLHTSLAFVLFAYLVVIALCAVFKLEPIRWRRAWVPLAVAGGLSLVFVVLQMLPALSSAAGVTAAEWPSEATPAEAFGQAVLFTPSNGLPQWWLGVPAFIGLVLMFRHRRILWLALSYILLAGVYAITVSQESPLIAMITGPFYNDAWRFAALLPLAGAIAVGEFVWTISEAAVAQWHVFAERSRKTPLVAAGTAAVVVLVMALMSSAYIYSNVARLGRNYNDGPTVNSGEREAYAWLAAHTAPGERVMNDVQDGSVWMYALNKVTPVEWTFYGSKVDSDPHRLTNGLNEYETDPDVRAAVSRLGVRYVVLGSGYVRAGRARAPGLVGLPDLPGIRLVFENNQAMIYDLSGTTGAPEPRGQAAGSK
ncbi:hypothetical protein V5P93_000152 [Actinokineospora auranticolor]|uniref:Uncharacterized protein n=1 Tax=Actinokineospora auranticolor TaxID=155976 RepID=A0A2S6GL36_9PSEU|nr:DUF6541 family protein [Actinokineospora auranticolor]PPK65954.1 hypothetical protein CLV40_112222 [Actinokineospora auranticolor]